MGLIFPSDTNPLKTQALIKPIICHLKFQQDLRKAILSHSQKGQ